AGGIVRVAVSAGRARVLVPDVAGFSPERAESLLRRAGFTVIVASMESQAPAGRVIRTEPQPGHSAMLPAEVTVIVSTGPPAPVEPDPVLPDTLPPPRESVGDSVLSSMLRTD
ncbi:MAG TPA: PASTA domain-containing protein, partial [Longimicrobiales bacterium]|nr:PASTA domain-containing protein [Longimicrobiales bacterium]